MHYELWATNTGNLIATPNSEEEALALVRELLESGWDAEDLALGLNSDTDVPDLATLPPILEGPELVERALEHHISAEGLRQVAEGSDG